MSKRLLTKYRGIYKRGRKYYVTYYEGAKQREKVVSTLLQEAIREKVRLIGEVSERENGQPQNENKNGDYVYFFETQGMIKIGVSLNVPKRLKRVEAWTPFEIKMLGNINGGYPLEKQIHRKFKHLRVKGEWFKSDDHLLKFIEEIKTADEYRLNEFVENF